MSVCDLCRGPVPRENDVFFLEKVALFLDREEKGMLDQEFDIVAEKELVNVLGFEMTGEEGVMVSRHLEPVFDSLGKLICRGDRTRMRMIAPSKAEAENMRFLPHLQKRLKDLKEAHHYLKVLSTNPYSKAMERGEGRAKDS